MADLKVEFMAEDGHWVVTDYTSDDYTTYRFKTIWDEEYNLIEFYFDNRLSDHLLSSEGADDSKRCKLAVSRHQKKLLQVTGVIDGPDLENMELYVLQTRNFSHHFHLPQIQKVVAERITQKQIKTKNWNYNKAEVFYCPVTDETTEMVKEYNEAISEFTATLKGFRNEIFGTRCSGCGEFSTKHKYVIKQADWPEKRQRWETHDRYFDTVTCYTQYAKRNEIEIKPHHEIT